MKTNQTRFPQDPIAGLSWHQGGRRWQRNVGQGNRDKATCFIPLPFIPLTSARFSCWVLVDRNKIVTKPDGLVELDLEPEKLPHKLVRSPSHALNFIQSVKSRQPTVSPIESAVQADAFCHISDIAIRLGRRLRYDGKAEKFPGDKEDNQRLLVRPLRKPWKL